MRKWYDPHPNSRIHNSLEATYDYAELIERAEAAGIDVYSCQDYDTLMYEIRREREALLCQDFVENKWYNLLKEKRNERKRTTAARTVPPDTAPFLSEKG